MGEVLRNWCRYKAAGDKTDLGYDSENEIYRQMVVAGSANLIYENRDPLDQAEAIQVNGIIQELMKTIYHWETATMSVLHYTHGATYKQIADAWGCSSKTIARRVDALEEKIKQEM